MVSEQRRRALLAAIVVLVITGIGTVAAQEGQDPAAPPATEVTEPPTTTTTLWWSDLTSTTAPPTSETTAPPTSDTTAPPTDPTATTAPPAGEGGDDADDPPPLPEDEGEGDDGGGTVPASARAVMSSIPRTAANDSEALVQGAAALEATGVPHDEAMRITFGSFPIYGAAHWTDDWYNARWTGSQFRYHLGLDLMAAYGTPVVAPADGVARISSSALGGLSVRVVQPDGTFYYLAHLSGTAEGLVDGAAVTLGQTVGYVGDSGNARGGSPHLHFAIHPQGREPVPPKPIVDQWVADGAARVVQMLSAETPTVVETAALVATDLTRQLADGVAAGPEGAASPPRSELLWASAASPNGGAVAVADAAAASLNESVDWEQRGAELRSRQQAWSQSSDRAWQLVAPLMNPALRQAMEARRGA
jgi:hypothetical protein